MTSPLRRKRRTTAPVRSTPVRMAASLLGLGLFLAGGQAQAQSIPGGPPPTTWDRTPALTAPPMPQLLPEAQAPSSKGKTLHYGKDTFDRVPAPTVIPPEPK